VILTWDERKRLSNLDKHGLDFADLTTEFLGKAVIQPGKHGRLTAIAKLEEGIAVVVVFARLGSEAVSVISMRPASKRERAYAP
jgi:uncharacterized DUF497 family protein